MHVGDRAQRDLRGQPTVPRLHPRRAHQCRPDLRHAGVLRVDPGHLVAGGVGRDRPRAGPVVPRRRRLRRVGQFRPIAAAKYNGLEQADSFILDPHKWLFTPFDCCALLYREPALARATHTQDASYLDVIHATDGEWNPSDYAYHLTRRARGLPLWFSLAVYGLEAYRRAIEVAANLADGRAYQARTAAGADPRGAGQDAVNRRLPLTREAFPSPRGTGGTQ